LSLSHVERKVRREAAILDVRNGMTIAAAAAKHGFTIGSLAVYVKRAKRGSEKANGRTVRRMPDLEVLRASNDKNGDRPAWQCLHSKCSNMASWCCPLGGAWRACDRHRIRGDERIRTASASGGLSA
jgi:hypothetical protein